MSKLTVLLEPVGERWILFQVLEMDERFRRFKAEYRAKNGRKIISNSRPILFSTNTNIFLRGRCTGRDREQSLVDFKTTERRDTELSSIKAALTDWAANWEGWKDESPAVEQAGNVYEF